VTIEKKKYVDLDELQQNYFLSSTSSWIVDYKPGNSDDNLLIFFEFLDNCEGFVTRLKPIIDTEPLKDIV